MWIVAKVKFREINIFKKDLTDKVGGKVNFYFPTVECQQVTKNKRKIYKKQILENYIFCYHEKFKKSNYVNKIKFLRGLEYFLEGYNQNQSQISKFIEYCKSFENEEGYLTQSFFKTLVIKRAKFVSGPFTNIIFEILEKQKNKLKILLGDIVTTIPNTTNYLYRPI